jgi:multicopper oxidase
MSNHFSGANLKCPGDDAMAAATDAARSSTDHVSRMTLDAAVGPVDLGGVTVHTWSYGGQLPGPAIRARKGDVIRAVLANRLPDSTTIHWHGIALRNDMDGVPGLTPGRRRG